MRSTWKKAVAVTVCLSLGTSLMAGCGKKKPSRPVPEGDFYNVSTYVLGDYDSSLYDYLEQDLLGVANDLAVVHVMYDMPKPSDFDYTDGDYSLYQGEKIEVYDLEGTFVASYDMNDIKADAGLPENAYPGFRQTMCGDTVLLEYDATNYSAGSSVSYFVHFDPSTGSVTGVSEDAEGSDIRCYDHLPCGDSIVYLYGKYNDSSYFTVDVEDMNGERSTVDLGRFFEGTQFGPYMWAVSISDHEVLFQIEGSDGIVSDDMTDDPVYKLDTVSLTVERFTDDLSWIGTDLWMLDYMRFFDGMGMVSSGTDGLSVYDFDAHTAEMMVNYDRCNANIYDLRSLLPYECSDGKVVMGGNVVRDNYFEMESIPMLAILTKSETDPYEKRNAISLAILDSYLDYPTAEAVRIFNDENPDYYIYVDTAYSINRFTGNGSDSEAAVNGAQTAMTNQLMIDFMAGDGPDLVLGGASYSQFCNDDILADLSEFVPSEGYFDNVFDACRQDGKLYSIPLYFAISGICTEADNVAPGQTGFGIDEYDTFVRTVCNGNNPIRLDKLDFFLLCLQQMESAFKDSDGKIDYDNEAFRALARYVNDNVLYLSPDVEDWEAWYDYNYPVLDEENGAVYDSFYSIYQFVGKFDPSLEIAMLGVPSSERIGPSVDILQSVAMSAATPYREGCSEFISVLLSGQMQDIYAAGMATPVKISSYETAATITLQQYNAERERCVGWTAADFRRVGMTAAVEDFDVVYRYEDYIRSCTSCSSSDPAVTMIIREEIPAYFEGQKTIDEVIGIIMNRVETYLNERG